MWGPDDSPPLTQTKRLALLAYLALARPRGFHRRDALLAHFWPELDDAHARNALSQALTFLRRALPEGVLVSRGSEEVGLDPDRVDCDVVAFEQAIERGDWEQAVDVYRGELLAGLHVSDAPEFGRWLDGERERLREAASGAAWSLADQRLAAGQSVEAERAAQRALALSPTDESPVREFIAALARAGDRAAALRFYEKFRGLLAETLEVEPAPDTAAVAAAVRSGEVAGDGDVGRATVEMAAELQRARPASRAGAAAGPVAHGETRPVVGFGGFSVSRSRFWLATAGIVLAALGVGGYLGMRGGLAADTAPPTLVVLPPSNQTGDPALDDLGKIAAGQFVHHLSWAQERLPRLVLVQASAFAVSAGAGPEPPEAAVADYERDWPTRFGATLAVTGSYHAEQDSLRFMLRVVDETGQVLETVDPGPGLPLDNAAAHLGRLTSGVVGAAARVLDPYSELSYLAGEGVHTPDPKALVTYMDAWMLFGRASKHFNEGQFALGRREYQESRNLSLQAARIDSMYVVAALGQVYWYEGAQRDSMCGVIRTRFETLPRAAWLELEARCAFAQGEHRRVLDAQRELVEFYPNDVISLGMQALRMNRLYEAEEAYARYDPDLNDFSRLMASSYWNRYSRVLHLLGKHRQELKLLRGARRDHPEDVFLRRREIAALIGLGRVDEALDTMEAALAGPTPLAPRHFLYEAAMECEVHGCADASSGLWQRLLDWYEDVPPEELDTPANKRERALQLMHLERDEEALVLWRELMFGDTLNDPAYGRTPMGVFPSGTYDLEDLGRLGITLARVGHRVEALAVDRRLADWPDPWINGFNTYWRACIAANLGHLDEAVDLLWQAEREGWLYAERWPHWNTHLRPLRGHEAFEDYMKPRG